jgi:APA family basic amino acid/polyamine antiporter
MYSNPASRMFKETREPERTIPKALILAFFVTSILYFSIAFFEIGIFDWQKIGVSASPLEDLAIAIFKNRVFIDFISFLALIAPARAKTAL